MTNYILEGNINFSEELMKLLCEDESNEGKKCLISGEKLEENHIKLDCNHCFNYEYIFNEVRNQRKKNRLETQNIGTNQIKCPYCRSVSKGILPWYDGYQKIKWVNWKCDVKNMCEAILKSGKRKGEKCGCNVKQGKYCGRHKSLN